MHRSESDIAAAIVEIDAVLVRLNEMNLDLRDRRQMLKARAAELRQKRHMRDETDLSEFILTERDDA